MIKLLIGLWGHFESKRRRQIGIVVILTILASFAEVISIAAIIPFLGVLVTPEKFIDNKWAGVIVETFNLSSQDQIILPITIIFIVVVILSGTIRLLLLRSLLQINMKLGADLAYKIFSNSLYQDYSFHVKNNSSDIVSLIIEKTYQIVTHVIGPALVLFSNSIIFISILSILAYINPILTLFAFSFFGLIYFIIIVLMKSKLSNNGLILSTTSPKVVKIVQEGLGGIRDIISDSTQNVYTELFGKFDRLKKTTQASSNFIGQSPRFMIETIGIVLIAVLSYYLTQYSEEGLVSAIPTLGMLVIGAQRMLPLLQQSFNSWSNIQSSTSVLNDALKYLDKPVVSNKIYSQSPIVFKENIRIDNVSFAYENSDRVLDSINLTIPKGSRIGIIGSTGSGKSTLVDIIMGLLEVNDGFVSVDGKPINKQWLNCIAHVPQDIFLTDSTIAENIAFGVPQDEINYERVISSAKQAHIDSTIKRWKDGYKTTIGERGVRLSGGQRQRIGIARALYKKTSVIIFDESTSALDIKTEKSIMESIDSLNTNLTIIIITHRLTLLKGCSKVFELNNSHLSEVKSSFLTK